MDSDISKKTIKYNFGPVDMSYAMKDEAKKNLARQGVLSPLRRGISDTHIISLISSISMDTEP
jgi:hypothetical protein